MKLLLDTNVLFSGLGFRGLVGSLLEEIVRQGHTIVSSEYILAELQKKVRLKFKGPQKEAALDLLLYLLQRIPLDVKPLKEYQPNLARARTMVPEQDAPILAVAMLPEVDYFVTGDKHFLENEDVLALPEVEVKSPRAMLTLLRGYWD
jgi:putative PIN family toxin of toxin-antitoxin system